ncbi:transcriptional regulator of RNA polII, SAGA, subunit-domain-containing protein [Lophiotrema nucula]|uniref:Transcriptional regulator of RNA polII, SAGA, subunit-domain-containing protein n=1 Tax=Lophiotrema nucula TaxID=690887 RepID=A0A6A5YNC0_9PLEO|nr:transcriptional regulator of RNA polII, SAGA, subunit-domain-containing protein [Lophiotrema nucula]
MATIRPDALASNGSPSLSLKPLPAPAPILKPAEKRTVTAPRIDVEPLYHTIRSAISDTDWLVYKSTISQYLLGNLNQAELGQKLGPILSTPALEHAHNQFVVGVFGNCLRDAPEPGVASWVSREGEGGVGGVGSGGVKGGGDEVEKRLKSEVMQLSRRERKRLKVVKEQGEYDPFTAVMNEYRDARTIRIPDTGPASAGGFTKTNWDLEIRKRYTQPLFTETHEFPDPSSIASRMLPICYEYGLPSGNTPDCAAYMNIATETYIKEALMNLFQRVNSNGPGFIRTADFKRRVEREEDRVAKGELGRNTGGLLPAEVEESRKRRPLCMEDLRLALELGDSYLGQVPLISGQIANSKHLDAPGVEQLEAGDSPSKRRDTLTNGVVPNGITSNGMTNGFSVDMGDPMVIEDDWSWQGGGVQDVDGLDSVLDGCMAVGV